MNFKFAGYCYFKFKFVSYDARVFIQLQHTTDEEAAASKRLVFYFIFCAIIQLT